MEPVPAAPLSPPPPGNNAKMLLIIVAVLALLGAAVSYSVIRSNPNLTDENGSQEEENITEDTGDTSFTPIAKDKIIYGTWGNQKSLIKSFDLETGKKETIATIKDEVKKVSVLSGDTILYINNTDKKDHGQSLSLYNISNTAGKDVYKADPGFGIDDYVVSPDGNYVAVWEVRFAQDSGVLREGSSRVYSANINTPAIKHRLYDEVQVGQKPVHYPLAITNTGQVYLDTFLPNTLYGWAYGMSTVNFEGTQKEDIASMADGTYATQPALSPDGRYLAFAGFSTPQGKTTGDARIRQGARANIVALYDLQSKTRTTLANLPTGNTYHDIRWDGANSLMIWAFSAQSPDGTGIYHYDLTTKTTAKIAVDNEIEWALATLENGNILVGIDSTDRQSLGNLGYRYSPPFTEMYVLDASGQKTDININDNFVQFITVLPSSSVSGGVEGSDLAAAGSDSQLKKAVEEAKQAEKAAKQAERGNAEQAPQDIETDCDKHPNQQLCPFYLKEINREEQQTVPLCYEGLAGPMCEEMKFANRSEGWRNCVRQLSRPYRHAGQCVGSPLYLYGTTGQSVSVSVNTHTYNSNASYENSYDITLLPNNRLEVGGKALDSVDFDYTPGIKRFDRPSYGTVVSREKLPSVLTDYAIKLGLNKKETEDIVKYGKEHIGSPFVFVSFFDQKTSKQLLPLRFAPVPDNYYNIVFYFAKLGGRPDYTPKAPIFSPITNREGLTAVEVSSMVE